ncbi:SAM-dependent methyltransferase [Clostridium cylindrosporum]|uniref:Putative fatty acid methyltransferase n=1 Tax=Clostridium cylindrosporum DSM 605 TaxID=1121307 RepID=A0A0J8G348_CLOCY|nr:cyclopropane-fatty-acyl-phospholipid synthase family protein [Clostridium cylindrosporum]KMT22126.1 putative fatty acid methyltransferase [Clostridium cylindrosporum DSM 605]
MLLEKVLIKRGIKQFDNVNFSIRFKDGEEIKVGDGESKFTILVNDSINKKEFMKSTSLALGEAYMDRVLDIEGDLFEALNMILSKMDKFSLDEKALKKIMFTSTSKDNQKEEVSSHYDIGNDFYKLWLDNTMSYSCAYFKEDNDDLYSAQCNKINYILKKLNLREGMSLLDIGCGWGNLLITAAKNYKVRGVGITLSKEQYNKFQERVKEEGLEDYIEVKLMDYRDLRKSNMKFDRIVSVGMLEHVGRDNYNLFFENADAILNDGGMFLLHYISGRKEYPGDPWIKKYIFPGGVIPSLREIINIGGEKDFYVQDVESLRRHYVKTLLCWYDNFNNEMDKISTMFDERFIRMWELYLCSCAAAFNNGVVDLHQIVFTKGICNDIPMTREHLYR